MIVLDTCAWIEWIIDSATGKQLDHLVPPPQDIFVPTIVQHELAKWLAREKPEQILDRSMAYVNEVVIVPIQSDPPGADQLGVVLDLPAKKYIGLPDTRLSCAIVPEVNIDVWPNAGIQDVPGKPGEWAYQRPMPGPKLAEIAKAFRLLRDRRLVKAILRHP